MVGDICMPVAYENSQNQLRLNFLKHAVYHTCNLVGLYNSDD